MVLFRLRRPTSDNSVECRSLIIKRGNWIPLRPKILRNDLLNHSHVRCRRWWWYWLFLWYFISIIMGPHVQISMKLSRHLNGHTIIIVHTSPTTVVYSNHLNYIRLFSLVSHKTQRFYLKSHAMNVSVEMLNAPMVWTWESIDHASK